MNPKMLEKAMKQMGIKQEQIEASEVIIKCADKDLVIRNPQVSKVKAMGQETFQISGTIEERNLSTMPEISAEDIQAVMDQAGVDQTAAKEAIKKHQGDLAEAILDLTNNTY